MYELRHYSSLNGQDLFAQWLDELSDRHAQARIAARLLRLQNGNFGDCRFVGGGVWEQKMSVNTRHDDWLFEQLKEATFAAEFLNAASEDDDPKTYLTALRKVVEARGGMAFIAGKADLSRETLYRTLSVRGNPTIKTLTAVLKATGLKFGITAGAGV